MRLKGISWIEQNFEKVFAGFCGVAALGVLTWQFAGPANTVTVGKETVQIDQAFSEVAKAARLTKGNIERQIKPEDMPVLLPEHNPAAKFNDSYRAPVSPTPSYAAALGKPVPLPETKGLVDVKAAAFAPLKIAPPGVPFALPYVTTVDPSEATEEVKKVLPPAIPYDKAHITVEATFDGKALRRTLAADPDDAGPLRALNPLWWEGMQLLAVELERQELGADGKWGKDTKVAAMPGRFSQIAEINAGVPGMDELLHLKEQGRDRFAEVRRPTYYREMLGEKWMPPSERVAQDAKDAAAGPNAEATLRRELAANDRDIARLEDALSKLPPATSGDGGGGGGGERRQPPPPPRGGGGGGSRGGGGDGGGRQAPQPAQPSKENDARRLTIEKKIGQLKARNEDILKALGLPPRDAASVPAAPTTNDAAKKTEPLLDTESLRIWAHDVTVERGKVYRYRMTLVFDNPMYGKGAVMLPEQAEWSRTPIARSEPSEWSDPARMFNEVIYFVTSASTPSDPTSASNRGADARAELATFTTGYWRLGASTVEPGDTLQANINVPDLTKLPAPGPNAPPPPEAVPPPQIPGGRKGGGFAAPPSAPPPPPSGPAAAPQAPLPTVQRTLSVDAILLGVERGVLAADDGRGTVQAFLRRGDGSIEIRFPEAEKDDVLYARIVKSAEESRQATMPPPRTAEPTPNEREDRRRPDPSPNPGSGGGGAG